MLQRTFTQTFFFFTVDEVSSSLIHSENKNTFSLYECYTLWFFLMHLNGIQICFMCPKTYWCHCIYIWFIFMYFGGFKVSSADNVILLINEQWSENAYNCAHSVLYQVREVIWAMLGKGQRANHTTRLRVHQVHWIYICLYMKELQICIRCMLIYKIKLHIQNPESVWLNLWSFLSLMILRVILKEQIFSCEVNLYKYLLGFVCS